MEIETPHGWMNSFAFLWLLVACDRSPDASARNLL
jgi:hypothetical protein